MDTTRDRSDRSARLLVWAAIVLLLGLDLWWVAGHTRNIPVAEDWHMVPPLTGHEPNVLQWLWAQNNEHRTPLPRLVQLTLLYATQDFHFATAFNILPSVLVVVGLVFARARRVHATDVVLPILFLHSGHWMNYGWNWQICFVIAVALQCLVLREIVSGEPWSSLRSAVFAAAAVVALPLCGANGLVVAFPLAAWLTLEAVYRLRAGRAPRAPAIAIATGMTLTLLVAALYFVDYQRPYWNPPSPGLLPTLVTTLKLTAMAFGPAAHHSYEISTAVAVALAGVGLWTSLQAVRHTGDARSRGVLAFGISQFVLTVALGYGRAALVPEWGLPDRYALLSVPLLAWTYLVVDIYAAQRVRVVAHALMLVACIGALPFNIRLGIQSRNYFEEGERAVEADIRAGVPREVIVQRHQQFLLHWNRDTLSRDLVMLREARFGPFALLREE